MGLLVRRQAGKKRHVGVDSWVIPKKILWEKKNNNVVEEEKEKRLTERNVGNVGKMLYKHPGYRRGIKSPEETTQGVWWEGGDSTSVRTSASQAKQLRQLFGTERGTAMPGLCWS